MGLGDRFLIDTSADESDIGAIPFFWGAFITNPLRMIMGVLIVIWTFTTIASLVNAFQLPLQWGDIGSLVTIIYNCLMGFYLLPIVVTDLYLSCKKSCFCMVMSNCLYILFFLSNFLATIVFDATPVNSNQNSIDIHNILHNFLIFDIIIMCSLVYPIYAFCVTLNTCGYKKTLFGNGVDYLPVNV